LIKILLKEEEIEGIEEIVVKDPILEIHQEREKRKNQDLDKIEFLNNHFNL